MNTAVNVSDAISEEEGIRLLLNILVPQFSPGRVILFGSRARGDAAPDSDYDLLVVVDTADDKKDLTVRMLAAVADLPLFKDIIVATPAEIERRRHQLGDVVRPAIREGREIYVRS